jgi:putative membrane protein
MNIDHSNGVFSEFILALPFMLVLVLYILAAVISSRWHKPWPFYRYVFCILGILCATIAMVGPLAHRAHFDFTTHMIGHLLLGMLAPLFIALATPMTLVLRTLNVRSARRLSRVLKTWPVCVLNKPIVASLLHIGGLWVLYTTDLYFAMQQNNLLHILVHIHVFLAGYFFTVSMIYMDPTPHRFSFVYRAIVMVTALAGHGILSKYIYAYPPNGVPITQAETAGMLMYYGGDAIDLVLICIFFFQWFRATRPKVSLYTAQWTP